MSTHRFKIEGRDYTVEVGPRSGNTVQVTVNGRDFAVEVDDAGHSAPAAAAPAAAAPAPPRPAAAAPPPPRPAAAPKPRPAAAAAGEVRAPISGVVLNVLVSAGDTVTARTQILVLEAMKMENEIFAGVDGTVVTVHVQAQQEVREGDLLVTIDPS